MFWGEPVCYREIVSQVFWLELNIMRLGDIQFQKDDVRLYFTTETIQFFKADKKSQVR